MAIILDADVIISGERGTSDLEQWLVSKAEEQFAIAAITVAELWHDVERATGAQRHARERYLQAVIHVLPTIPYTEQTAYHHARLWADLEGAGKMIGSYELIVAATALEREAELATFNKKHFAKVPRLRRLTEPK
jgi:tRNA(fMet)-specific endonuclease VapC